MILPRASTHLHPALGLDENKEMCSLLGWGPDLSRQRGFVVGAMPPAMQPLAVRTAATFV